MNSGSESSLEIDHPGDGIARTREKHTKKALPRSGSSASTAHCVPSGRPRSLVIATAKQVHQSNLAFVSSYLFFMGTFLLTMSCTLASSGVWCLLFRLPVIHLVHGPTRILVGLTGYMIAAGSITFPASCILYRYHNVTQQQRPLLPVIALLSICTIFLTCCASHAIAYRKSAYSDLEGPATASPSTAPDKQLITLRGEEAALLFGTLRDRINAALTSRLQDYPNYSSAWDLMQARLQCCGVNSTKTTDQAGNSTLPALSPSPSQLCQGPKSMQQLRNSPECSESRW